MRLRAASILAVLAALAAATLVLAPVSAAAPPTTTSSLTTPITGTTAGGGSFVGSFTLDRFTTQNGQLAAVGTLTGTITDAAGTVVGTVNQLVTVPLAASGSCQILHLTLGPLDLDLLGLQVHLNRVVLDITAQSGPGNLLGNLLCGVAHLLDGGASANTIATILNRLLALL